MHTERVAESQNEKTLKCIVSSKPRTTHQSATTAGSIGAYLSLSSSFLSRYVFIGQGSEHISELSVFPMLLRTRVYFGAHYLRGPVLVIPPNNFDRSWVVVVFGMCVCVCVLNTMTNCKYEELERWLSGYLSWLLFQRIWSLISTAHHHVLPDIHPGNYPYTYN